MYTQKEILYNVGCAPCRLKFAYKSMVCMYIHVIVKHLIDVVLFSFNKINTSFI